jgi:hemerythrin
MLKETEETIIEFLVDWFVHHTLESDRAFGLFITQK